MIVDETKKDFLTLPLVQVVPAGAGQLFRMLHRQKIIHIVTHWLFLYEFLFGLFFCFVLFCFFTFSLYFIVTVYHFIFIFWKIKCAWGCETVHRTGRVREVQQAHRQTRSQEKKRVFELENKMLNCCSWGWRRSNQQCK